MTVGKALKAELKQVMAKYKGHRDWKITESEGTITIKDLHVLKQSCPPRDTIPEQTAKAVQVCAARRLLGCSSAAILKHFKAPFGRRAYHATWMRLGKVPHPSAITQPGPGTFGVKVIFFLGARQNCELKIAKMIEAYKLAGIIPPNHPDPIRVRLGIDGTQLWKAHLEVLTVSLADFGMAQRDWGLHTFGLYVGKETIANLQTFIANSSWNCLQPNIQIGDNRVQVCPQTKQYCLFTALHHS